MSEHLRYTYRHYKKNKEVSSKGCVANTTQHFNHSFLQHHQQHLFQLNLYSGGVGRCSSYVLMHSNCCNLSPAIILEVVWHSGVAGGRLGGPIAV